MNKQTVLITGASSGIGLEMARIFAADGNDLVLVARREAKLKKLADELTETHGIGVRVCGADLAEPTAPQVLYAQLEAAAAEVDILVNNAGFGARGTVVELEAQRQLEMIQVNVTALTHLTRLLLPGMLKRKRGGVLNVGSTAGFQPGPNMSVYYATKAYVLFFTEGLAEELRGTGVHASCLAPGATVTGFAAEADMENTRLFRMGAMDAAEVARAGIDGFRRRKVIVVPGLRNKAAAASVRFTPRPVVRRVVKSLQD